jgi:hypothetical protein
VARLPELLAEVRDAASRFEADRWSGEDCARLSEELARAAKACAAASARAAAHAMDCGRGDVEWVARTAGITPSQARQSLATTAGLAACQATSEAVAEGAVSLVQAREIVQADAAVPGSERSLLQVASSTGMAGLRRACRNVRLASVDRDELHRRQWAARSVRHWVDGEGMIAGTFCLPPEVGLPFVNRLDAQTDRIRRSARREGNTDAREAHAADALLLMAEGASMGRAARSDVVFVVSLDTFRRGCVDGEEVCHAIGSGPVPVGIVREAVAADAFVKAVMLRGVEVHTVAHFGRRRSAELRTALGLGPAPAFEGVVCVGEGCDRRHDLEWDHVDPVANDGVTSYENMKPRCRLHHWAKTERDRAAGLLDGGRAPP